MLREITAVCISAAVLLGYSVMNCATAPDVMAAANEVPEEEPIVPSGCAQYTSMPGAVMSTSLPQLLP